MRLALEPQTSLVSHFEFGAAGEIMFFDKYIIPLAKKLDSCGVFGVSSDECLNYAKQNRKQWAIEGDQVVEDMLQRFREKHGNKQREG